MSGKARLSGRKSTNLKMNCAEMVFSNRLRGKTYREIRGLRQGFGYAIHELDGAMFA